MSEYRWVIAHFSPTGTTLKVARAIAGGSGCPSREVDLSAPVTPQSLDENEILLVAAPVFGGRIPGIALERLKQLNGRGRKAVAAAVYGNRAFDDALLELKDVLEELGFALIAAGAFIAEHSIIRSIAAGRPDARDLETAAGFGRAVMEKLAQADPTSVDVPGDPGYRENIPGVSPHHPSADGKCVSCGLCARLCPLGAIPADHPAETDGSKCINCMRCVSVCPQKARSLPAPMLAGAEKMLTAAASVPRQAELFL